MNQAERLQAFRADYSNRSLNAGGVQWNYRICGGGTRTLLMLPGGELVNDMAFDLVRTLAGPRRVVYPAYPRVDTLADLVSGPFRTWCESGRSPMLPYLWCPGPCFGRPSRGVSPICWARPPKNSRFGGLTRGKLLEPGLPRRTCCPTSGTSSNIMSATGSRRTIWRQALRDTYPQAEVCTFHGAGQAPAFSRAGEYLQVLDRFLAS